MTMVITYMVNDTFIWNTVTTCRYGILAFGSMMYIDRFFNHCVQYLVQYCGTQLYLWNTFTLLDSISCHDIIIRILQSNKCWPVLFLWIHNWIETTLYSATTEPWMYEYKMTAMTGYRLSSCMCNSFNWIVRQQ